jgi:argininosuccinate lyase
VVGKLVSLCIETGKTLETLELAEYQRLSPVFDEDVYTAIALETCVNSRNVPGGPSAESVAGQTAYIRRFIEERKQ